VSAPSGCPNGKFDAGIGDEQPFVGRTQFDRKLTSLAMHFRKARPDEAESLTRLVMEAKAHWGYSAEQLEAWRPTLAVTAEQLRSQPAFVLEGASVVGFYSLRVVDGTCELENLWVVPSEVGRGYGRKLLVHAANVARSMGLREILIDADPNAENFYVHCGASITGAVPAPIEEQPGRTRPQLRFSTELGEEPNHH